MSTISHGDIYWYDFGAAVDERQAGLRPVFIIQTDFLNSKEGYGLTVVIPLSTKGRASHVKILPSETNGLSQETFIKFEQIHTIPKTSLRGRIGKLDAENLKRVKAQVRELLVLLS